MYSLGEIFYGADWLDVLAIGCGLTVWLLMGMFFLDRADRMWRYVWGAVGIAVLAVGEFYHHGIERFLWLPIIVGAWGVLVLALARLAIYLKDARAVRAARRDPRVRAVRPPQEKG